MSKKHKKIEIDAAGMAPGRLATRLALFLTGKHKINFVPYLDKGDKVEVKNVDKMVSTGKKLDNKIYRRHSMHPGGLKETPAKKVFKEDPKQVLILAVTKMLPKNKFREDRLNRIKFV